MSELRRVFVDAERRWRRIDGRVIRYVMVVGLIDLPRRCGVSSRTCPGCLLCVGAMIRELFVLGCAYVGVHSLYRSF